MQKVTVQVAIPHEEATVLINRTGDLDSGLDHAVSIFCLYHERLTHHREKLFWVSPQNTRVGFIVDRGAIKPSMLLPEEELPHCLTFVPKDCMKTEFVNAARKFGYNPTDNDSLELAVRQAVASYINGIRLMEQKHVLKVERRSRWPFSRNVTMANYYQPNVFFSAPQYHG